ncbi:MAG: M3 family oligoendopeptidase [Oligoflexus sp.]
MTVKTAKIQGPSWDNSAEYQDFSSSELAADRQRCLKLIEEFMQKSNGLAPDIQHWSEGVQAQATTTQLKTAIELTQMKCEIRILVGNLATYAQSALSVDGSIEDAKILLGQAQSLQAKANAAFQAHNMWLSLAPEATIAQYLADPTCQADSFFVSRLRLKREQILSLAEEELIKQLEIDGPTAWGNLYDQISSQLQCQLEIDGKAEQFGLAQTTSLLESPDPDLRQKAYRSIEAAWQSQQEACAASVNALAGWRLQLYERRSFKKPMHFLDDPLVTNCIEIDTLNAMMDSIAEYRDVARQALRQQTQILGLERLGPWDLFAPYPQSQGGGERLYTFDEAIQLIKEAFSQVHQDMSDFVDMMVQSRWVEGTVSEHKRPGAYCTKFLKSRTPRIYMTYNGGMKDIITLAHELGHAFHNWVIRDLPLQEISYPMTLAETASILSQTVVNRHLMNLAHSEEDKQAVLWTDAREAEAFLLNIPVRFTFEKAVYEKRQEQVLSPKVLNDLMSQAWRDWYGDTLSEPNRLFWASKLHFHISGLSFYNFPYSFGYLFSLGVLAQKKKLQVDFYPAYINLLRDTGRMTAEELAQKHLAVDLRKPEFWLDSLKLVEEGLHKFAKRP